MKINKLNWIWIEFRTKVHTNLTSLTWSQIDATILSKGLPRNIDYTQVSSSLWKFILIWLQIWPLDDLRWPWKYHQISWLKMMTIIIIPTKFQVHMKIHTSNDLRWPLDDLRKPKKYHQKFVLAMVIIPTKFQLHTKVYNNMISDDPWMTSDDLDLRKPSKTWLEMVAIPTKFQIHTKVYTNMISNDPWMIMMTLKISAKIVSIKNIVIITTQVSWPYNISY